MPVNPYASNRFGKFSKKQQNILPVINLNKHLHGYKLQDVYIANGPIRINKEFFITKTGTKFRPISRLDWAHYTPNELAVAIMNNTVLQYYAQQLQSASSPPNEWKDPVEEVMLKDIYAERVGRTLDGLDNL